MSRIFTEQNEEEDIPHKKINEGRKHGPYLRKDNEHSWIKHRMEGREGKKHSFNAYQVANIILAVLCNI